MYCMCDTACLMPCAVVCWLRVNSARTLVEYCSRPTCVPVLETSNKSTMLFTKCLTSSKLAGPKLLEPSITKTRSMTPLPHSGSVRHNTETHYEFLQRKRHYFKEALDHTFTALPVFCQDKSFQTSADVGIIGAHTLVLTAMFYSLTQVQTCLARETSTASAILYYQLHFIYMTYQDGSNVNTF